jgi:hypothetical protein
MRSQEDFKGRDDDSGRVKYLLYQENNPKEDTEGELKTLKNDPDDPNQREDITFDKNSSIEISVRMTLCIHGKAGKRMTSKGDANPDMSLMIFDFEVKDTSGLNRIQRVQTWFEFDEMKTESGAMSTDKSHPSVVAFAPFKELTRENITTSDKHQQVQGGLTVGADQVVSAHANISATAEGSWTQKYFDQGDGGRSSRPKTNTWPKVWWTLVQNQSQKQGVASHFSVAILLTRKSQARFIAKFQVRAKVNPVHDVKDTIRRWFRLSEDDPIIFNPTLDPQWSGLQAQEACEKINSEMLGSLASGDRLTELVSVWGFKLGSFRSLDEPA